LRLGSGPGEKNQGRGIKEKREGEKGGEVRGLKSLFDNLRASSLRDIFPHKRKRRYGGNDKKGRGGKGRGE